MKLSNRLNKIVLLLAFTFLIIIAGAVAISIFSAPVSAATTYSGVTGLAASVFKMFDRVILLVSKFFRFDVLRGNTAAQVGFIKFWLFILLFTLFKQAFNRMPDKAKFDPKAANVMSFVIALIGVIFMKDQWVLGQGGLMAALASVLLPVIITILAFKYAFKDLTGSIGKDWLGVLVLFTALWVIVFYMNILGFTANAAPLVLLIPAKLFPKKWLNKKWQ